VVQKIIYSSLGIKLFPKIANYCYNLSNVIFNNLLSPEINGEYWLVDQFPENSIFIDVGFNNGEWSEYVLRAKQSAKVFAFDPCVDVIENYQKKSVNLNNLELIQLALSNQEGNQVFYDYGGRNGCNSLVKRNLDFEQYINIEPKEYIVEVTTLDNWCNRVGVSHVNLLKIDAEGYDLNVLEGASHLLDSQSIDVFVFEYASGWFSNKRFLWEASKFIDNKPYRLFKLFNGFLAPFEYKLEYEGLMRGMFVGISNKEFNSHVFKLRNLISG
jgi:FkbM family methyltransferase